MKRRIFSCCPLLLFGSQLKPHPYLRVFLVFNYFSRSEPFEMSCNLVCRCFLAVHYRFDEKHFFFHFNTLKGVPKVPIWTHHHSLSVIHMKVGKDLSQRIVIWTDNTLRDVMENIVSDFVLPLSSHTNFCMMLEDNRVHYLSKKRILIRD